jgi:glycosyltransferase involved in cell wall biosynthesis
VENKEYSLIVKYMYDSYKKGCINSNKILTISETSKAEIIKYFKINEEKVAVCYEGVDNLFVNFSSNEDEIKSVRQYYNLPEKYLFGLVSVREYKNSLGTVKVFHHAHKKDSELRLVLFGWPLATENKITKYIKEHELEEYVVKIPNLRKFEDLLFFYHLSYAFIFLSFKEGFGLPPIEAIACKTFAITSNVSSLGEIYNGILPTFNPDNYEKVSDYLLSLTPEKRSTKIEEARKDLMEKYTWNAVMPLYLKYIIKSA